MGPCSCRPGLLEPGDPPRFAAQTVEHERRVDPGISAGQRAAVAKGQQENRPEPTPERFLNTVTQWRSRGTSSVAKNKGSNGRKNTLQENNRMDRARAQRTGNRNITMETSSR